ncbi:hypothetical protein JAAARDRAFT_354484 [Jaapia argillacea MUCL 33604]|uniref:B30.2/SPRY domain-containing protein n=1 Tax=Jaapia argillacea MUCL 33604 TaxID=933084 RepID=A0A067PX82_9AGAM|nr:hypothetical protein JAAARDRAFT_354484 [Jaapia argillacea MUCL 33604]
MSNHPRQIRSLSIPIPGASSAGAPPSTSPTTSRPPIESVISIPFTSTSPSFTRTRVPSSASYGSLRGYASSTSLSNAGAGGFSASPSSSRHGFHGSRSITNPSPINLSSFEPRRIRANGSSGVVGSSASGGVNSRTVDPAACSPPVAPSTSPLRARRQSSSMGIGGAGIRRAPSSTRGVSSSYTYHIPGTGPGSLPSGTGTGMGGGLTTFPRPSYLSNSSLRDLLQTEAPPTLPPSRYDSAVANAGAPPASYSYSSRARERDRTPATDSDDESSLNNASPPPPTARGNISESAGRVGEGGALVGGTTPVLRLPTRWSDQDRHPNLSVGGDGRDLSYNGPSSSGEKDAAAARTNHPIPPACGIYYYEVEIVNKGQKGHISIGCVPLLILTFGYVLLRNLTFGACRLGAGDVRLSRLPGWERHSWGYHGDDGYSFAAEKTGTPYGPRFENGDIIGCGIDFSQYKVFYTKNGAFLGLVFDNVGKEHDLYPSVGLRHAGESVRVNFGHEPFKFDIDDHVQQQRNIIWTGIMDTKLDLGLLGVTCSGGDESKGARNGLIGGVGDGIENGMGGVSLAEGGSGGGTSVDELERAKVPIARLVLGYLEHHGYANTARALKKQFEHQGQSLDPMGGGGGEGQSTIGGGVIVVPPPVAPVPVPVPIPVGSVEDQDMDMDDVPRHPTTLDSAMMNPWSVPTPPPTNNTVRSMPTAGPSSLSSISNNRSSSSENDFENRLRIVNAVIAGDVDTALDDITKFYPKVLDESEGMMKVKLRCRKFVELMLEAGECAKRLREVEREERERESRSVNGMMDGMMSSSAMDIDDSDTIPTPIPAPSSTNPVTNGFSSTPSAAIPIKGKRKQSFSVSAPSQAVKAATARYSTALNEALAYGQALRTNYKDARPEVGALFKRTFGIVAYEDPASVGGEVAEVVGQEARAVLANELNMAILKSQGRATRPGLERVYRQTAACIVQLGLMGVGAAAFADLGKEFLDKEG